MQSNFGYTWLHDVQRESRMNLRELLNVSTLAIANVCKICCDWRALNKNLHFEWHDQRYYIAWDSKTRATIAQRSIRGAEKGMEKQKGGTGDMHLCARQNVR